MNNAIANTTAEEPEIIRPELEQSIKTVRVNNDLCLGVITLAPRSFPAHTLPKEHIQSIPGVYGVCADGTGSILQILFDGKPETEIRFLLLLQNPA